MIKKSIDVIPRSYKYFLWILLIIVLSGCIDLDKNISAPKKDDHIVEYGDGYQIHIIYPLIYGDRLEIIFPNNEGEYVHHETYMKFIDGNNTCYSYIGSPAAGNSISCVKDR